MHAEQEARPNSQRWVLLGNSGSGKSTAAQWLASRSGAACLDLDMVAWEPGEIAVPRDPQRARDDVQGFCARHERWVIEGCYAELAQAALKAWPEACLLFLDPGVEVCIAHCRARPWEPHKYASADEQHSRLAMLIDWVRGYDEREGELGRAAHQAVFAAHTGRKLWIREALTAEILARADILGI